MRHAREDYKRFQDPEEKIPEDEPVFLIRAQDAVGPEAVKAYAEILERRFPGSQVASLADEWADEMAEWQEEHGSKEPDL